MGIKSEEMKALMEELRQSLKKIKSPPINTKLVESQLLEESKDIKKIRKRIRLKKSRE